jgi:hypothetical protein
MLTESRRWTCKSSGGSGGLGGRVVEDGGGTRQVAGDTYEVCYPRRYRGFTTRNLLIRDGFTNRH